MLELLKKTKCALLALFFVMASSLTAFDGCDCNPCDCGKFYVGAFGGGLYSNSTHAYQMGTAFFEEDEGGPLAVYGKGKLKEVSTGFGGIQVGYQGCLCNVVCSDWSMSAGAEVEAYWYGHKRKGHLINNTERLPEHDFYDSFRINSGVYLANILLSFNNCCFSKFSPYLGVGLGAARVSLRHADSLQIDPLETGINHFNSRRNDSSWAFAGQIKAGLRYQICEAFHIFGEYRYLFIDSTNYIFGSTVYSTHVPTSPWNVKLQNMQYNAFAFGFRYDL